MRRTYVHAAAALAGMTATYLIGVTTAPAFADRDPPACCVCPTTPPPTGQPTSPDPPRPTPTGSTGTDPTAGPPPPITHQPPPPPVSEPAPAPISHTPGR